MEVIIKELIRTNIPKYSNGKEMLNHEFTNRINEESVYDLLEVANLDVQMNYLEAINVEYCQLPILDLCNLYVYTLAKRIMKKEFPKLLCEDTV